MSGGSYRYLFNQFDTDIIGGQWDAELQQMADRLAELGYPDAAKETLEVLLECRVARNRVNTRLTRLADIWHEVEWEDSGDGGHIDRAIATYRGETP